jgi:hypothetical protein
VPVLQAQPAGQDQGGSPGTVLRWIGFILGELYALYLVAQLWDFAGTIASFLFFPVALAVTPL